MDAATVDKEVAHEEEQEVAHPDPAGWGSALDFLPNAEWNRIFGKTEGSEKVRKSVRKGKEKSASSDSKQKRKKKRKKKTRSVSDDTQERKKKRKIGNTKGDDGPLGKLVPLHPIFSN